MGKDHKSHKRSSSSSRRRRTRHKSENKSDDDDESIDRRRHGKSKSSKKKSRPEKEQSSPKKVNVNSISSQDSFSSEEDSRKQSSSKRKRRKEKKSKKKKKKSSSHRYRSKHTTYSSHSEADSTELRPDRRKRRHGERETDPKTIQESPSASASPFCQHLHSLLTHHPTLATELPYLLIRMASGAAINLSQMPNVHASQGLGQVFEQVGCELNIEKGGWMMAGGTTTMTSRGGGRSEEELSLRLIRVAKAWLDRDGITMEAVTEYEEKQEVEKQRKIQIRAQEAAMKSQKVNVAPKQPKEEEEPEGEPEHEITSLTQMLLQQFQSVSDQASKNQGKDSSSSLAKELYDITNLIQEGESICLDGIPDADLKQALEQLFLVVGLEKEIMEDEDQDDEDDGQDKNNDQETTDPSYGFALPDETTQEFSTIKQKLEATIRACKMTHQDWIIKKNKSRGRSTMGPALPPTGAAMQTMPPNEESSSDEEDGPAPLGSLLAKKRKKMATESTSFTQKQMEQARVAQLKRVQGGGSSLPPAASGEREEWMMKPGEHDFLKGVMSSGTIKNRTFKNEKVRGGGDGGEEGHPDMPLDPKIKAEMDAIMQAHTQARGPSLIDQHREKKTEEKLREKSKGKGEWKWNRDDDLDNGRKVDKNHLHMVLGGAATELKNKFQGGYSKM